MDFAAYVNPSDAISQVGSFQYLDSGTDYAGTPLQIEVPQINGTIVSYMISGGVIGNTYRLSYFVLLSTLQIIQLTGYLVIVPEGSGASELWPPVPPSGGGGGGAAAPVITLTANPTSITGTGTATLTWSSTGATSLIASGGWSGSVALNGSANSGTLSATTTFTLTASGAGGSSSQSVTVTVTPLPSPPPGFNSQIQVTAAKFPSTRVISHGFYSKQIASWTPAADVGHISPTVMPAYGTATGQKILSLYSGDSGTGVINDLVLVLLYATTTTQTNQFDSVSVVDDTGATRTFTSANLGSDGSFSYTPPAAGAVGWQEWFWATTSPNPVILTDGKVYTLTFVKAS